MLPFACSESAAKIIRFLKTKRSLNRKAMSVITQQTPAKLLLMIGVDIEANDKLFSNFYALMLFVYISVYFNTKSRETNIVFDDLVVNGIQASDEEVAKINSLMECFYNRGYVNNLYATGEKRATEN